jgi:hypothetical protein
MLEHPSSKFLFPNAETVLKAKSLSAIDRDALVRKTNISYSRIFEALGE